MSSLKFTNYEGQKYELKIRKPRKEIEAEGICYPPKDGGCAKILINPHQNDDCLLYTSPSPRDVEESRMPSSA